MKIIMTGGGSGGHITPILAVAHEVKRLNSAVEVLYIGQTGDALADVPAGSADIDAVFSVRAGKLRRYHGEGLKQLLDIKTVALNLRDLIYVAIGLIQSYRLLRRLKPDAIFIKGGFVGVPVGLAAALLNIPYVTHDSDAIPGLANRIIARWAELHTVALPANLYPYDRAKTVSVGIPLVNNYQPVTPELQADFKRQIGLPLESKCLFIVGGGLGSQRINGAIGEILPHLLAEFPDLHVVQSVGRANEQQINDAYGEMLDDSVRRRVHVKGYLTDLYRYSGAADVVVTRAGATNLAEFSVQGKPCVVIPSPFLTGGHQLKNAQFLADSGVAVVVNERDMLVDANFLARAISELLKHPDKAQTMGKKFGATAHQDASKKLARLLLKSPEERII